MIVDNCERGNKRCQRGPLIVSHFVSVTSNNVMIVAIVSVNFLTFSTASFNPLQVLALTFVLIFLCYSYNFNEIHFQEVNFIVGLN